MARYELLGGQSPHIRGDEDLSCDTTETGPTWAFFVQVLSLPAKLWAVGDNNADYGVLTVDRTLDSFD